MSLLVENLIQQGWLKTPRIIEAFKRIKRVDFLPSETKNLAELNEALPIGYGQTISQPLVVTFMLELLEPREGEKILDVGSGSGWTSALLAHIVSGGELKLKIKSRSLAKLNKARNEGEALSKHQRLKIDGRVIAIEVIPELKEFGEKNIAKYNFIEKGIAECICADGSKGWQKEAPYDKILASASLQGKIPEAWKKQLKIGGRMVAPIGTSIWLLVKKDEKELEQTEYPGFVFVPLIER